jgi:hypothetical protein
MLTFPRSLACGCRAAPPPVRLLAGAGGLRLPLATPEAAAECHRPGPAPEAGLAGPGRAGARAPLPRAGQLTAHRA